MPSYSLRRLLTLQPLTALLVPFGIVLLLGSFWVIPQVVEEVELQQEQLGRAIVSQVERYLETSTTVIRADAAIALGKEMPPDVYQRMLDAQLATTESLGCLYVVAPDGQILAVGLDRRNQARRQDLLNLDLSRNPLFMDVKKLGKPLWSQVFLSMIHGGLSAAFAMPGNGMVVIGEVDLPRLNTFLKNISRESDLQIMIVDANGQVIADQDGRHTAQQLNIGNIPLVRSSLASNAVTSGRFDFEGRKMIGSTMRVPSMEWHVLVAQPVASLYRSRLNSALVVMAGFMLAALCGVAVSVQLSRKLAARFDGLIRHAREIASGARDKEWPSSTIIEFNQLSDSLRSMDKTLQQQEAGLRESEEAQRLILNSTCDGIYGIDTRGTCTFANQACLKLLGYDRLEELLGCNMHGLIHHSHADGTPLTVESCRIYNAYRNGVGVTATDEVFWRRDGSPVPVEYSSYPILKDGAISGAVISWRDVTERKRAEEEHQKLEQQLRQSQKMEALGQLAGGVAHDFNNILQVILGYASLLTEHAAPAQKEQLTEILAASERAAELTNGLLSYSRKQLFRIEPTELGQLMAGVEKFLRRILGEDITLSLEQFPAPLTAAIDRAHIQQVFVNLATNARDAMPTGGKLSIRLEKAEIDEEFAHLHGFGTAGAYTHITFSDTGTGIHRDHLQKIFEPFFTTKAVGKGTGLGLSIVYGIISQHNGFITCYSEEGAGTTFHIYLPLSAEGIRSVQNVIEFAGSDEKGGTVLVAEDDPAVRSITRSILEMYGYSVLEASSGREALALFREQGDRIDLVLLDALMPELNGAETLRAIRELKPETRALFMSGYAREIISGKMLIPEDAGFINKPVLPARLIEAIRNTLRGGTDS